MSLVTLSSLAVPRLSAEEAASPAPHCFELRTYFAAEEKLDALSDRLRNHATHLFVRHGMINVGLLDAAGKSPAKTDLPADSRLSGQPSGILCVI
jgi:hypothetical protein